MDSICQSRTSHSGRLRTRLLHIDNLFLSARNPYLGRYVSGDLGENLRNQDRQLRKGSRILDTREAHLGYCRDGTIPSANGTENLHVWLMSETARCTE